MTDTRQPPEQQPVWQPSAGLPQHPSYPATGPHAPAGMPPGGYFGGPPPGAHGQWGPPQGPWTPPQPARNGAAMAALILGIITLGLSPLPFLNQAGILVGFVGVGLGIAALVIGLRRRVRVAMSAVAIALSVLGLISSFAFTEAFVSNLNNIGSSSSSWPAVPAQEVGGAGSSDAPAVTAYKLSITGSAKKSSIGWSVDGSSGSADESTKVPWTKTMTIGSDSWHSATLYANTYPGTPGDLTCTITDQAGRVLDTKSAESQGGDYGSASVNCSAYGS